MTSPRLPTEIEEMIERCTATVEHTEKLVDESIDEIESLDFDDPSVVRHVEDLRRTQARARRESETLRPARKGA